MAIIGPGSQQEAPTDLKPLLEGANEYEFVTVLNPFSDDFAVRVAQDVPVNAPLEIRNKTGLTQNGNDVVRSYGLDLKNPEFPSRKHISIDTVIPAGQTRNFRGNEAQVAVRQLVNELMQREGNAKLLSDPVLRAQAEARIVQGRSSIQDIMDGNIQTPRNQIDAAITKSNEVTDDKPFPGLESSAVGSQETSAGSEGINGNNPTPAKRGPGRPAKAEQLTN